MSRTELKNVIRKECRSRRQRDENSLLSVARKMQKSGEIKQAAKRERGAASRGTVADDVRARTCAARWRATALPEEV
ncbi:hypothetical protein HL667_32950 [Bradyrhizobium sp. 83012]|uniref:Uncharacterized protein n=1 Tax=Bradyrhizobium aeschynomenes TaxID=2734909 RepID=A0ABX2CPP0_9BRAD|nr:hypothetical protein [Bradyrhizobium aeschynomenes]NPU15172.1 hypothetical protein [Bradyrhizobium aeschynomenes]NPU69840.1 hypothetical protein [Bradyrhizobium aeschynomenes]NPV24540.1 hypothetical protein [Bradyrhizobium aeschynomenes]